MTEMPKPVEVKATFALLLSTLLVLHCWWCVARERDADGRCNEGGFLYFGT